MCAVVVLCFMSVGGYAQSVALAFGDLKWLKNVAIRVFLRGHAGGKDERGGVCRKKGDRVQ